MERIQLKPWNTFDKFCLVSTMWKLKQTIGDQNWAAISRHTKQLNEMVGALIQWDERSDDWFNIRQCKAQYENLIKSTKSRKKRRSEKNSDNHDNLEVLEASLSEEFKKELRLSLADLRVQYMKSKKIVEDIDNKAMEEDRLVELLAECEETEVDVKSKLKSMLDEKLAENDNSSKLSSTPATNETQPTTPVTNEAKLSSTTSPLLTSLLQSPSPLIRSSHPSTSSSTISLLLQSSTPTAPDSTLSKLLESPNIQTGTVSTNVTLPEVTPTGQQATLSKQPFKLVKEDKNMIIEQTDVKTEEQRILVEDIVEMENDVVESEVTIEENGSTPQKNIIPRRLDLEVADEDTEGVIETVEEIIEQLEEAIIESADEHNQNEIEISQASDNLVIATDINQIKLDQQHHTVEVIVLESGTDLVSDDGSTILNNDGVIVSGSPVKINDDTVIIDDSSVKINNDTDVVIDGTCAEISCDTVMIEETSVKEDKHEVIEPIHEAPGGDSSVPVDVPAEKVEDENYNGVVASQDSLQKVEEVDVKCSGSMDASDTIIVREGHDEDNDQVIIRATDDNLDANSEKLKDTEAPIKMEESQIEEVSTTKDEACSQNDPVANEESVIREIINEEAKADVASEAVKCNIKGEDENKDTPLNEEEIKKMSDSKPEVMVVEENVTKCEEIAIDEIVKAPGKDPVKESVLPETEETKTDEEKYKIHLQTKDSQPIVSLQDIIKEGYISTDKITLPVGATLSKRKADQALESPYQKKRKEDISSDDKVEVAGDHVKLRGRRKNEQVINDNPKRIRLADIELSSKDDKTDYEEMNKKLNVTIESVEMEEDDEVHSADSETVVMYNEEINNIIYNKDSISSNNRKGDQFKKSTPKDDSIDETMPMSKQNQSFFDDTDIDMPPSASGEQSRRSICSKEDTADLSSALSDNTSESESTDKSFIKYETPRKRARSNSATQKQSEPKSRRRTSTVTTPNSSALSKESDKDQAQIKRVLNRYQTNTSTDEHRSWKKVIMLVYSKLASHKYASVFSKPITENEASGYHEVVHKAMDLSTIKKNIEAGIVRTTVEFQRDLLIMVQNAVIYNKYDTPYYKMALELGKDMHSEMEIMVQALGDGVPLTGNADEEKTKPRARSSKSLDKSYNRR